MRVFVFIYLLLIATISYAQQSSMVHYQRENGLPGNHGYQIYQDHRGYIWISTENGLARFNGYEFKVFTTKDGLPDNEVFNMEEDCFGRLWFSPFTNTVGYIKGDKVYNSSNDSLLHQLHFDSRPENIVCDPLGNVIIAERYMITHISRDGNIKRIKFKDTGRDSYITLFKTDSGGVRIIEGLNIFQYDGSRWKKIVQLPAIYTSIPNKFYRNIIISLGLPTALSFFSKAAKLQLPIYNNEVELERVNWMKRISPGILAIAKIDGCFLIDIATAKIVDTLLYGYNVSPCLVANDGSLWIGSLGNGVFRFIHSPIKSLKSPTTNLPVRYIKGTPDGMFGLLEKSFFLQATFDHNQTLQIKGIEKIDGLKSLQQFIFLEKNALDEWIACSNYLMKYSKLDKKPSDAVLIGGFTKDVIDEDQGHLLAATSSNLVRLDKNNFLLKKILLHKRVTSVAKLGNTIYAGTLDGLMAGDTSGNFHQIFSSNPTLNGHIVTLCAGTDHILWVANNKAELIAVTGDKITAVINDRNGLQCNRIAVIKTSSRFIWVGTDKGLYAINNKAPYNIVRHLTYITGLNNNQINCLDVHNGRVWIGTPDGVNYFEEQDIFEQVSEPNLMINSIRNGNIILPISWNPITLPQKTLEIDFDIIDYSSGQKPLYQYRLNNDSVWINLDNSKLYFPSVPYGSFTVSIKALSPNWKNSAHCTLAFYHPYPFYLRWWFLISTSLILIGCIVGIVALFIKRVRTKDKEKIATQRNLLQLEQMALQGKMNPHFIFNCIAGIKQYYSIGDLEKANSFVDEFASLIRQTFDMGTELFVSLDKELNYLTRYLSIEQTRFNDSFDFTIIKDLTISESFIYIPTMLLQPVVENAVRHGVRHLTNRRGEIRINIVQKNERIEITITDNGVGRQKSSSFGRMYQNIIRLTSTAVNTKRIDILNQLFEQQIINITEDILNEQNEVIGTRVLISYPMNIHQLQH